MFLIIGRSCCHFVLAQAYFLILCAHMQEWKPGALVWLRNSARDTRKKKFLPRWLGPYKIVQCLDKNVYKIARLSTGHVLKKAVNGCRLKPYHKRSGKQSLYTTPRLHDSFVFQRGSPSSSEASQSSNSGLGGDDTIPPLPSPMPPLSELKAKHRVPVISEDEDSNSGLGGDDTIPPLPSPMPPLSELKAKRRVPVISEDEDSNSGLGGDDTISPLNEQIGIEEQQRLNTSNTLETSPIHTTGITASTPILEGGYFPEFFPGTPPSPILRHILPTQPTSAKPTLASRKRKNTGAKGLMSHRRQKRARLYSCEEVITVEEYKLKKPEQSRKLWIPELNLAKSEQDVLLNPTAWLTGTLIDAAQILLKKANPAMSGLQSVVLGQTMNFDIEPGEFVQILHNGHGHWLTISTVGNEHPQVEVYDSAYSCCPTICKAQIAALLSTSQPAIELRFMDVQMQAGGYDCGLFAIAFATAVVLGQHPGLFCFDQRKMRQHFKTCLEQGCITMFPLKKMRRRIKVKTTEPIPVFCHCRMPELTQTTKWIECSNCKEWYHADACVQVEPKYFVLKCKWFCAHCNKI